MSYKVTAKRHLAKTVSYRVVSTGIGFLFMWWATGSITIGATFGIAELVYKPIQYYLHERFWYKFIKFGLIEDPEKKKKQTNLGLTEGKIKTQIKTHEGDLPKTQAPPPPAPSTRKVLNYGSNR